MQKIRRKRRAKGARQNGKRNRFDGNARKTTHGPTRSESYGKQQAGDDREKEADGTETSGQQLSGQTGEPNRNVLQVARGETRSRLRTGWGRADNKQGTG